VPALEIPPSAVSDAGQVWVVALLADAGLVGTRSEARRLVSQGAVRLDGRPVESVEQTWTLSDLDGRLLTVGRRGSLRLHAPAQLGAD
jgi:tyrosyl-tRNA synthetase